VNRHFRAFSAFTERRAQTAESMSNPIVWIRHLKYVPVYFPNFSRAAVLVSAASVGYIANYVISRIDSYISGARDSDGDVIVTGLFIYPIKSCAGIACKKVALDQRGVVGDREFMVVDENERFITQRQKPKMALICPRIEDKGSKGRTLILNAPGMKSIHIPIVSKGVERTVGIWKDSCIAIDQGDEAAKFFSEFLEVPKLRLVRMADSFVRPVAPTFVEEGHQVAFQDGYPVLLLSEESVKDLNRHVASTAEDSVPASRFRPNIVVRGCRAPYEEDLWKRVFVGPVAFKVVKPCTRCSVPNVDQKTAAVGKEPGETLRRVRELDKKIFFGQNLVHEMLGTIRVGNHVKVKEYRTELVLQTVTTSD